ncbi:MAG TPA: RDD family protein [Blastocatellia bacterium]|nr:RDD family protein [Blastocatellia bacterium]
MSSTSLSTSPQLVSGADELIIETPERVELYYTRAQVGNRFLAAALDHLIQAFAMAGIALAVWLMGESLAKIWNDLGNWAIAIVIMLTFAIYTSYFIVFETIWNGQTPGKRVFRLRVIREDGRPIRFYEALVRNLLRTAVDSQPIVGVPLYSVGIVSIFLSSRSKRVGDYVAGTVVIRESESRAPSLDDVLALARDEARKSRDIASAPFEIDASKLSVADEVAVRAFLRRRLDLTERVRAVLGNRIAASLAVKLAVPPVPLNAEQVLEEIDRQSRRRSRDDRSL